MDVNNLNSEVKRLFFQLLTTGNAYIKSIDNGTIQYEINKHIYYIYYYKDPSYTPDENIVSNTINNLCVPFRGGVCGVPLYEKNVLDYFNKNNINEDNVNISFELYIAGIGTLPIVNLSLSEYCDAVRIVTNVSKEWKLKQLDILDELTEDIDDMSNGI